jgi:hypothetical protein
MPAPRPFGIGPYGVGPYSRYRGAIYDVAATTAISFDASLRGVVRIRHVEAVTQIVFSPHALLAWSWTGWAPCAPGAWQPPLPCADGAWLPSGGCGAGVWTPTRLV